MSDDDPELKAAIKRLAGAFSDCPAAPSGVHSFDLDTGKCEHCGAPWPYHEADAK